MHCFIYRSNYLKDYFTQSRFQSGSIDLLRLVECDSTLLIYYPPKHLVTSLEEHPAVYPAAGCSSFCLPYVFITFIMYRYRADALKTDIFCVRYLYTPFRREAAEPDFAVTFVLKEDDNGGSYSALRILRNRTDRRNPGLPELRQGQQCSYARRETVPVFPLSK